LKIVITAAGHSRRFTEVGYEVPKFMLPVLNQSMLEQVLLMFSPSDSFLVVTTKTFETKHRSFFDSVKIRYRDFRVLAIQEHECGPVQTLDNDEVANWVEDEQFIVSYCDFFVNWDYKAFLDAIESNESDGCVVSFKGVQPASRGSTLFAYLRTEDDKVLEVKEKSSFTDNRIEEFASVGLYYFKSFLVFRQGLAASTESFIGFKERYVSLVYNGLIKLGMRINHFQAEQFVCLGTPVDYEEFLYWNGYFKSLDWQKNATPIISQKMLPMAGLGDRFRKAGIAVAKPMIPIRNRPMFLHSVNSFPIAARSIVVVLKDQAERVERAIASETFPIDVLALQNLTSGPGETILKCIDQTNLDEDLLIASCDYEQMCDENLFYEAKNDEKTRVIVFYTHFNSFRMKNPHAFAYCRTTGEGIVTSIVEKELLSQNPELDKLLVGSFWFRQGRDLKLALNMAEANGRRVNGEIFVANSLNELIELGIRIRAIPVTHWISFGDPDELEIYQWWEQLFNYIKSRD